MKICYFLMLFLLVEKAQGQFITDQLYTLQGTPKETFIFYSHGTYERTIYPEGKGRVFQRTAEYTLTQDTLALIYESISQELLTVQDLVIKQTPIANSDSIYIDFEIKDDRFLRCTEINCALETDGFKSFSAGTCNLNIPNQDYTVTVMAGTKYKTTVSVKKGFNYKLTMLINPYHTFIDKYKIEAIDEKVFAITDTLGQQKTFVLP